MKYERTHLSLRSERAFGLVEAMIAIVLLSIVAMIGTKMSSAALNASARVSFDREVERYRQLVRDGLSCEQTMSVATCRNGIVLRDEQGRPLDLGPDVEAQTTCQHAAVPGGQSTIRVTPAEINIRFRLKKNGVVVSDPKTKRPMTWTTLFPEIALSCRSSSIEIGGISGPDGKFWHVYQYLNHIFAGCATCGAAPVVQDADYSNRIHYSPESLQKLCEYAGYSEVARTQKFTYSSPQNNTVWSWQNNTWQQFPATDPNIPNADDTINGLYCHKPMYW